MLLKEELEMAKEKSMTVACKVCGAEIAKSAKACPSCGAKLKKPIYKRAWFIILCILLIGGIGSNLGGNDSTPAPESDAATVEQPVVEAPKTPTTVTADDMINTLDANALNAEQTYNDMYLEVTGKVSVIDSDGAYFSIEGSDPYSFTNIQCFIDDSMLNTVASFAEGQTVTVVGTVTEVGEVLGYMLDVESIK